MDFTKGGFTRYDFCRVRQRLRQAHDMIYDCCARQEKCRSILKHVLKRCDNRKSCRRPVIACRMRQKSYHVNRPLRSFLPRRSQRKRQYHKLRIFSVERTKIGVQHVRHALRTIPCAAMQNSMFALSGGQPVKSPTNLCCRLPCHDCMI